MTLSALAKLAARFVLLLVVATGCAREEEKRAAEGPKYPPDKVWTAAEVSADPSGYMSWADAKIATQVADRQIRIKSVAEKLSQIETRQQSMRDNLSEMQNISNRFTTAIRRAEDEDRWPVQVAGRKYDRKEAKAVLDQTQKYIEDRKPLSAAYDTAVARLRSISDGLNNEVAELNRLREKMALDLEAVRLTQSMDDLTKLRKSEAEIASYAKTLTTVPEDQNVVLPELQGRDLERVDLEALLNQSKKQDR